MFVKPNIPPTDANKEQLKNFRKKCIKKSENDGRKAIIVVYLLLIILSALLSVAGAFYKVEL